MSKFYGQVDGGARTMASRRGFSEISSSVQSWDSSIRTRMYYDDEGRLMVNVQVDSGSSFYGKSIFTGTFEQFVEKLSKEESK